MAEEYLRQFEVFFRKASVDLNAAKVLLKSFYDADFELDLDVVMFHLQQGAEKALKSILDYHQVKFPHTHDLESLIEMIGLQKIEIYEKVDELIPLSEYAVEGRYGVIHDDVADAEFYVALLQELLCFVRSAIGFVK